MSPARGNAFACQLEAIMEVLQLAVIQVDGAFCIGAYDESEKRFCRVSKEDFVHQGDACKALFSGSWNIA